MASGETTDQHRVTFRNAIAYLRQHGVLSAIRAGLRVANLNYQGYYWYARYLYRARLSTSCQTTDPFTVIWVSPNRITRAVDHHFDRWDDVGAVEGGEWDRSGVPLMELIKYRSLVQHFEGGRPWPETDVYQRALEEINQGRSYWNGSSSERAVEQRCEHIEDLYTRIDAKGYKSQEDIHQRPLRDIVLDRRFDRSKEEIAVAIGRSGDVLFVDGNHRLAIAQILDLDAIPVHVIARHESWEELRGTIRSTPIVDLEPSEREYLDHPDIELEP